MDQSTLDKLKEIEEERKVYESLIEGRTDLHDQYREKHPELQIQADLRDDKLKYLFGKLGALYKIKHGREATTEELDQMLLTATKLDPEQITNLEQLNGKPS